MAKSSVENGNVEVAVRETQLVRVPLLKCKIRKGRPKLTGFFNESRGWVYSDDLPHIRPTSEPARYRAGAAANFYDPCIGWKFDLRQVRTQHAFLLHVRTSNFQRLGYALHQSRFG